MTQIEAHTIKGMEDGPKLLIFGAVHGNEHCGPKGIRKCLEQIKSGDLKIKKGSVTFVPVCNPAAYEKNVRCIEHNLNRIIYPHDNPTGPEEEFANQICKLIESHDILLDIHSYSSGEEPFLFLDKDDAAHRAYVGALPFAYWLKDWNVLYAGNPQLGKGTCTFYAHSQGKIAAVIECGNHKNPHGGQLAYESILACLHHFGLADAVKPDRFPMPSAVTVISMREMVIKDREGKFTKSWKFLDRARKNETIAIYNDGLEIKAPYDAVMIMPLETTPVGTEWFYLGVEEKL